MERGLECAGVIQRPSLDKHHAWRAFDPRESRRTTSAAKLAAHGRTGIAGVIVSGDLAFTQDSGFRHADESPTAHCLLAVGSSCNGT